MDLTSERDPFFARYESTWRAYQAVQTTDPHAPMHYKKAVTDSANPFVRAAAKELAAARDAWLTDLEGEAERAVANGDS